MSTDPRPAHWKYPEDNPPVRPTEHHLSVNPETGEISILFRHPDGDYSYIGLDYSAAGELGYALQRVASFAYDLQAMPGIDPMSLPGN